MGQSDLGTIGIGIMDQASMIQGISGQWKLRHIPNPGVPFYQLIITITIIVIIVNMVIIIIIIIIIITIVIIHRPTSTLIVVIRY
jgi:hypothetical protein